MFWVLNILIFVAYGDVKLEVNGMDCILSQWTFMFNV